ncbi:WD40-repeat-containing domain protein [Crucibulum laeve]|uniref:WD40-repeat-containing domain protein n=1 Tax=Crucibulum laeve TaxID=68775 RepID=A0A5C3M000_9AGAR|nr:WD40-repeat-containing domain protein [Crucibulum laeve]
MSLSDLSDAHPAITTPTGRPFQHRRDTILKLVDMLLHDNEPHPTNPQPQSPPVDDDDRDAPSVEEHIQTAGAEAFSIFRRRIKSLDRELRNFANATRQLGSSIAILSSTCDLRERLAEILLLYHENSADLFPKKVAHVIRTPPLKNSMPARRRREERMEHKVVATPNVSGKLDPESIPEHIGSLARDLMTFLDCLNQFPEFSDEASNASFLAFLVDLEYWASCLNEYSGQFRYPAVQRYIHDLAAEMGVHMDSITSTLSMFTEVAVPSIRFAQKHAAASLLNIAIIATVFSAVTATTLQFSISLTDDTVADAVNCFWFGSLVFSIGAAVNSLLGMTWRQSIYRSPMHRVPWWVIIWIKRSPLVFLVISIACFSVGLCCFAYTTNQSSITSTVTTIFTAFTSFGLAAVSTWVASERWIFLRHHGRKWLSDALLESQEQFSHLKWVENTRRAFRHNLKKTRYLILRISGTTAAFVLRRQSDDTESSLHDLDLGGIPTLNESYEAPVRPPPSPLRYRIASAIFPTLQDPSKLAPPPMNSSSSDKSGHSPVEVAPPSKGKLLWKNAFRAVKVQAIVSAPSSPVVVGRSVRGRPRRITSPDLLNENIVALRKVMGPGAERVPRSRLADLLPNLTALEPIQDLAAHQALVRHLQFSPDGKYLATSSWDRTSVIFRVGDPFVSHRILAHAEGFVGQVAWSPNGKILLTKLPRGMKIWTAKDGVCKKTVDRRTPVESMAWCPGGEAFLSVEGSYVTKLDLNGNILDQYYFGAMKLHDVSITPDSQRLIGVGPLLSSPTGLHPKRSRVEKRLVVYNTETKQIENQTPVLNDVRGITMSQSARSGLMALVSYENKAPPQLWKLELVMRDLETHTVTARLTLRHTYMPKTAVDFKGPSYFGGKNDELVVCAGKAGDIHIWDRESATLLHHIRGKTYGGDLTCIAWNHASEDPFMFATGSHDGGVRVWSKPPPNFSDDEMEEQELTVD